MYRKGLRFCWVKYRYASRKCKIFFFCFFFNPPYLWAVHDRMQLPVRRTTTGNGRGEFYRMAIDGSYWIVSRNRWFKHTATFSLLLSTIYGCENMREKLFFSFFYSHREDKGYNISTPFFSKGAYLVLLLGWWPEVSHLWPILTPPHQKKWPHVLFHLDRRQMILHLCVIVLSVSR